MANLIRFSPSTEFRRLQREIDRIFDGYWPTRENGDTEAAVWSPRIDLSETEDAYVVRVDVPGVSKDDLEINFHDGTLSVSGNRKSFEKEEQENYLRVERAFGHFYRSFALPASVISDNISANYEDGVLTVRVPKAEESRPRRIQVS